MDIGFDAGRADINRRPPILLPKDFPLPYKDKSPDRTQLRSFVDAHPTLELQRLVGNLTERIDYVSFEEFSRALKGNIDYISGNLANTPYVVVTTDLNDKPQKSDHWVTNLAEPNLQASRPRRTLATSQLREFLRGNQDVASLVLFDDASYSGEQLRQWIGRIAQSIQTNESVRLYVAVPFMTSVAEELVGQPQSPYRLHVTTLGHKIMPTIGELLAESYHDEELVRAREVFDNIWDTGERVPVFSSTLTYFQHKIPDHVSFPAALRKGEVYGLRDVGRYYIGRVTPAPIP